MTYRRCTLYRLVLVAAMTLWTSATCLAAHRLTEMTFERGQTGQEWITLSVQQGSPAFSTLRFPEAGQGLVVLRDTELAMPEGTRSLEGALARTVTVFPLSAEGGSPSVQVTVALAKGATMAVELAETGLRIRVEPESGASAPAPAPAVAKKEPILISNADFSGEPVAFVSNGDEELIVGHGQDPADVKSNILQGFQAYVPENVTREAPKTEEARERTMLEDKIFQTRVTLDFKDADLQNVVRAMAKRAGINLIMTRTQVKGSVTLQLTDVRLGVALDAILKTNALAYVIEQGGIVRIVPLSQVKTETIEKRTEYIPINWVQANSIRKTLRPLLSEVGTMEADPDSNGLIVSDIPERVEQVSKLVERMDLPERQVLVEARLVDLTEGAQRSLGINWGIDKEMGNTGTPRTGTSLNFPFAGDVVNNARIAMPDTNVRMFGNRYNVDATLDFLETRSMATTLANPKVITLNNLTAKIEIIEQIPYISAQQTGQNQIATVQFKEAGVTIEVTPNVTNNGFVRMTLKPNQKVETQRLTLSFGEEGIGGKRSSVDVPVINERTVESSVIVRHEETVVLGGLRQLKNRVSDKGVPWLMRIPVLGTFFKNQTSNLEKLELVLFITPHILMDPMLAPNELRLYEQIDYSWDLPDYFYDEIHLRKEPKAGAGMTQQ